MSALNGPKHSGSQTLLSQKMDMVTPYFNQQADVFYNDDGELIAHSLVDNFNKQLITNQNPKTIQEELKIKHTSNQTRLSVNVKKNR